MSYLNITCFMNNIPKSVFFIIINEIEILYKFLLYMLAFLPQNYTGINYVISCQITL